VPLAEKSFGIVLIDRLPESKSDSLERFEWSGVTHLPDDGEIDSTGRKAALASILNFLRQLPRRAQEGGNLSAVIYSLGRVSAVLDRVPVTLRWAG
jgi:hypothetical protein